MNKQTALQVGAKLAKTKGLINLSRAEVCEAMGITDGSWHSVVGCTFTELLKELKDTIGDEKAFPVSKKRTSPELRKDHILTVALKLAEATGYTKITAVQIADAAGIAHGTVLKYFGTMAQLKNDVMRKAVKSGNLKIIAQGLSVGDRHAKKVSDELKADALKCLI